MVNPFDRLVAFRLYDDELKDIKKLLKLKHNRDIYFNMSHFYRCAVIKLIREEQGKKDDDRKKMF